MNRFTQKQASTTEIVSEVVKAWVQKKTIGKRVPFTLDGTPLNASDIGDPTAALPLVLWHADTLYRYGINVNGIGCDIRPDPDALFTFSAYVDRTNRSISEILCFVVEALEDSYGNLPRCKKVPGAVDLRELATRFLDSMGVQATPRASATLVADVATQKVQA
jgi:hypothetical protein